MGWQTGHPPEAALRSGSLGFEFRAAATHLAGGETIAHGLAAAATASTRAEALGDGIGGLRAQIVRGADFTVGDGVADANVHGAFP